MVFVSGLQASSGLIHWHSKLPFKVERYDSTRFNDCNAFQLPARMIHGARIQHSRPEHFGTRYAMSGGRSEEGIQHQLSSGDDLSQEPFYVSLIKDTVWGLRSLFVFLAEQPSQLKYIEWPGLQSTVCIEGLSDVSLKAKDCCPHSCSCSCAHCGSIVS